MQATKHGPAGANGARGAAGDAPGCIFSVDVEDWFHILDVPAAPRFDQWAGVPSHVETDFRRLLDLFDEHEARVTCFFLAWVAERHPDLVREAAARGHEIASHGYAHQLVFQTAAAEFHRDIARARDILEQITGTAVLGYRSPGFSCTEDVPWYFDTLVEAGYVYDSSVFPARRGHGGMADAERAPHIVHTANGGRLIEFPISVASVLGRRLCLFGGGYLRLFPSWMIEQGTRQVLNEGRPVIYYVHPREVNPSHPRIAMSPVRRFKSYVNLDSTEPKVRRILERFEVTTFERYIQQHPRLGA
ncbi:MAG TPA: XrtA system polysaccharide deacetylase [Candidatus Krumholzibacteria bacterium]